MAFLLDTWTNISTQTHAVIEAVLLHRHSETANSRGERTDIPPIGGVMSKINLEVIDQMFAAQMSMNENEETIKALRPQVEEAVQELLRQQGKPKNWTGIMEYHGFKIRVQRPKSYTWELNNSLDDPQLDYYKQLHGYYTQLQSQVKEARADLKRTAERLEKAHPNSESIKYGFTVAVMK